jgi:hypothetical protein
MAKKEIELCDRDCNNCPIITHPNSRMVTYILNSLYEKMSDGDVYSTVQQACPNLTCCFDCHIDDFCHFEGCKIQSKVEKDINPV